MANESLRISPRYTVGDWKALDFSIEEGWQKAVNIFEDRFRKRFLKPISVIEKQTYSGFAVLALDCLLIESLQQFRKGIHETPPRKSKDFFVQFLTETSFRDYFNEEMAEQFYEQIRCGILHQAEVKGSSRVRTDTERLIQYADDKKGLVVNRKLFHRQLVREFDAYVAKLRDPSNVELRTAFRKKMDSICGTSGEIS